jgi:hypothetical protein
MRRQFLLYIIIAAIVGCDSGVSKISTYDGDLYFDLFRFANFYNQPDDLVKRFKTSADSIDRNNIEATDKEFLDRYDILKNRHLLYQPYILLKQDNGNMLTVYLDSNNYKIFTTFHRKELIASKEKIRIRIRGIALGHGMVQCSQVQIVKRMPGATGKVSSKFLIDDYR